jgi:hypothetical protein
MASFYRPETVGRRFRDGPPGRPRKKGRSFPSFQLLDQLFEPLHALLE